LFDLRLQAEVLKVVDVSCGGENGFNQAIEFSLEILSNVKSVQEKRLIGKFLEEVSQDNGKLVYGLDDTMKVLEMSAFQTLIIWEDLNINRYVLKNIKTDEIIIKHLNKEQQGDQSNFQNSTAKSDLEVEDEKSLLEWYADEYQQFGCLLEIFTDNSEEGSDSCRGFGGIGGILRYQLDTRSLDEPEIYEDSE
jgi:peptide chain release factor subunit 1